MTFLLIILNLSAFAVASAQPLILSNNFASKPFAGIGGISGGGATSRALFDYPDKTRSALMDLLFSPQYGASFAQAKVEIPGDADTTCGSEVAHRHDADDGGSCFRGYEGFFLQQATQRGVLITSSLQWAAPLFVGEEDVDGGKSLFTLTNIDEYVIPWLNCMKSEYNVSLTFNGAGWNEHPHNNSYIKLMRSRLDAAGLSSIGIAASDECCGSNWNIARDMAADPQLSNAVDVITTHVAGSLEENTPTPIEALSSGKPLSQGEEHIGMPDPDSVPIWEWAAAASVGIEINQNWVVNSMTSTVYWPAAYAWPAGLLYRGKGFIVATCPWGSAPPFFIPAALFVVSHTTHFTAADGSWYLTNETGSGHIGDGKVRPIPAAPGGWNISYVSYVKKDDAACLSPTLMCPFTLVVESFFQGGVWHSSHNRSAGTASPISQTFTLADGLQNWIGKYLYVWHSNVSTQFVQEQPIIVAADGTFTVVIEPSSIWTITTVKSAHPGGAAFIKSLSALGGAFLDPLSVDPNGPQDAPFPIPFADDFEGYNNDTLPLFSADMFGAFTVFSTSGGPPPLRYHHPDESIRASVPCSTLAHAAERPSRCRIPSPIESHANARTLRQWVRAPPIGWGGESSNMATIYGNSTLVDIRVNVSVMIETVQSGYEPSQAPYILVGLHGGPGSAPANGGGASPRSFYQTGPDLDFVWLSAAGQWGCSITGLTESFCATSHTLPTSFNFDTWHNVSIGAAVQPNGDAFFSISYDLYLLANATVPLNKRKNGGSGGYVALVSGATRVQWDNLLINRA